MNDGFVKAESVSHPQNRLAPHLDTCVKHKTHKELSPLCSRWAYSTRDGVVGKWQHSLTRFLNSGSSDIHTFKL